MILDSNLLARQMNNSFSNKMEQTNQFTTFPGFPTTIITDTSGIFTQTPTILLKLNVRQKALPDFNFTTQWTLLVLLEEKFQHFKHFHGFCQ